MNEELKIIITAEIAELKKEVDKAKKQIDNFSKESKKSSSSFQDSMDKMGSVSTKALKVVGVALVGMTTALLALGASTEDFRVNQAKLNTAFVVAGGSAETAAQVYNDLYRVLGEDDVAVEAANHLAQLTTNQKSLSEWTDICQGVYATFGDSIPIESLTEAANETAKTGELTGALTDALVWAGVSEDDFKAKLLECNTEAEREALIRETLTGLYSDAAAGYEENAAAVLAQHEAEIKLNQAMADLGAAVQPLLTLLAQFAAEFLTKVSPAVQSFANKYGEDLKKTLLGIADAIGKVIGWIADNWNWIAPIAAVVIAIAAAIAAVTTALTIYNTIMAVTSIVSAPVILILAAIAAAIALLIVYWDDVAAFAKKAWEVITDTLSKAVEKVKGFFNGMKNAIMNVVNGIKDSVTNVFNKIKDAMSKPIEKARDLIKGIIDKIKGLFKFEWSLPKLKVPKFGITPKGWQIGDLLKGTIPKLGITWNAMGGVFEKPTIMSYGNTLQGLGEAGAEAVVPLENNLEWLDKLATMLAEKTSNGAPIVLQVDGKTFAKTSIKTINNYTKQSGKLAIEII